MASLFNAGKAGLGNVIKNKVGGKWIGWRLARIAARELQEALGADADSAFDLIVNTGTAGEFGTAAAAHFLTDEFRGKLSPGHAWLLQAVLGNISEHLYPEFVEEIERIRDEAKTNPAAAKASAGALWEGMVDRGFASVNPSGETGTLRYLMPLGGTTTYYAPGHGTGAFDRQKAAFDAAGYGQHYIHMGSRPADTRALSVGHHGLIYFEGEATFDEALADPNGQLCRADYPLLERAMQAQLKAQGESASAWNRITNAERDRILNLEGRLMDAVIDAEEKARDEDEGTTLTAMERFLAMHAATIRDSSNQMRECSDVGLLKMVAKTTWPADLPTVPTPTAADITRHEGEVRRAIYQVYAAIDRAGGQASADRRAEQSLDNSLRWASRERRRIFAMANTLWGRLLSSKAFLRVAGIVTILSVVSAVVGFILIVGQVVTSDLVLLKDMPHRTYLSDRIVKIVWGLVLGLPFAGVLYAWAGIVELAGGVIKTLGRAASAVGHKVFGIEVASPDAEEVFGRGRYFQKFAAGYLIVLLLVATIPLGVRAAVDGFLCAHMLAWELSLAVVVVVLGGGIVKAAGDLMKGLSAAANADMEKNARRSFKWLQLIPMKAYVLLVIVVPLALPVIHVTGALKPFQAFQEKAVIYVDRTDVGMPDGTTQPITVLGGLRGSAKACSNHRIHLPNGRPANTNDWRFDREWNGVLLAAFTGMELLKAYVDATTGLTFLDGFSAVTLESAFPGATLDKNGLVKADSSRSSEFMEGTPDENFVVQSDGYVRIEPRPAEPSAASSAGVSAFLGRTPGYAFWVLAAVFFLIFVFSLPERRSVHSAPEPGRLILVVESGTERSVRFTVSGICLLASIATVVAWFVRASIVG